METLTFANGQTVNGHCLESGNRLWLYMEGISFMDAIFGKTETVKIDLDEQCPDCNGTFHVSTLDNADVCPACGGKLIVRADDTEATVRERLSVYNKTTLPLVEYYTEQGKIATVDGNGSITEVYQRVLSLLKK